MTVPDTICGLTVVRRSADAFEVRSAFDSHWCAYRGASSGTWIVCGPDEAMGEEECQSLDDAIRFMSEAIRSYAATCRAFADKVLGEP